MNTILWIAQGLVAFAMVSAGLMKVVRPKEELVKGGFTWAETWSPTNVKLLGLAEVLGGIGLVVPWATHILPLLTPIAALCLFIIMCGAIRTHLNQQDGSKVVPAIVLTLLCAFIAWGRHGVLFA
jgi:hypothetical protein